MLGKTHALVCCVLDAEADGIGARVGGAHTIGPHVCQVCKLRVEDDLDGGARRDVDTFEPEETFDGLEKQS